MLWVCFKTILPQEQNGTYTEIKSNSALAGYQYTPDTDFPTVLLYDDMNINSICIYWKVLHTYIVWLLWLIVAKISWNQNRPSANYCPRTQLPSKESYTWKMQPIEFELVDEAKALATRRMDSAREADVRGLRSERRQVGRDARLRGN